MRRREFIVTVAGWAAWPIASFAQAKKRPLIAWLGGSTPAMGARNLNALIEGLNDFGYNDGKNINIVYRWADGNLSRQPALARELAVLKPEVIIPANGVAARVAMEAAPTVSIICPMLSDPITFGLAASYNHPGGNVTGIMLTQEGLTGKQLALLLELMPHAGTVAVLTNPTNELHTQMLREAQSAAQKLSVKIVRAELRSPDNIQLLFEGFRRDGVDGLVVLQDAMLFTWAQQIIALAAAARLPAIHGYREHSEAGGLISYSVDIPQNFRRAAYFVDKVLKGSRPADLPIEFPTKLELIINLKTARTLDLTVPDKLLALADEAIE